MGTTPDVRETRGFGESGLVGETSDHRWQWALLLLQSEALPGFSSFRNIPRFLGLLPPAFLPFALTQAGSLSLQGSALHVPVLETHKVHFWRLPLGSLLRDFLSSRDEHIVLPENLACGSTVDTNCLFDTL